MKIIFMGTPDFAVASLEKLHASEIQVAAVVTAVDKPAGRGRKIHSSAVKQFAVKNDIPVLQPANLKSEDFHKELSHYEADLFVVVAFRMLPKIVWNMPPLGTINLHASLLPHYRGAAPINWAIINGETETGLTTFFINEVIDSGDLLLQQEVKIDHDDDLESLHDRLMEKGASLLLETVRGIRDNKILSRPQHSNKGEIKEAPKLNKDNTRIIFTRNALDVYNFIRGLSPFPAAYTYLHQNDEEILVKIYKSSIKGNRSLKPGEITTDNKSYLYIGTGDGDLEIHELQFPGKKRMKTRDLLNGFSFQKGAYMA